MKRAVALAWAASAWTLTTVLVACGGGARPDAGPTALSAPQADSGTELRGTVLAGSAPGATLFLDLNNDQSQDAGEPATLTAADGAFSLAVGSRTASEWASAMLVAQVPDSAIDPDDGGATLRNAGRGGYTLMAPAAAFLTVDGMGKQKATAAVISPLTTMVAAEVAFNGLTPAQAAESVQGELGLGARDPLGNYIAQPDAALRNIARAAAIALGQSPASPRRARDRISEAATQLKASLPAVIRALELDDTTRAPLPVATIQRAFAAAAPAKAGAGPLAAAAGSTRFIVKFRESVTNSHERGRNLSAAHRGELRHSYSRAIKGFAVTVPDDQVDAFLAAALRNPEVEHVEQDFVVRSFQTVQTGAAWGLDRADQRDLPLNSAYSYAATGSGVRAYIVDTGIRSSHAEFEGRVGTGFSAVNDGRGTEDCHGHGTHVAGIVGGKTWGMAKAVTLVPVRVLDCQGSGFLSAVVAALDWIVANNTGPAVANLSLGGGASISLDAAVARAVSAGVAVTVAAGNENANACNSSPAREASAITVGATTSSDARSSFSNFGTCLDVFGPGSSVTSAGFASDSQSAVMSGTSMAAPHVAGLAALFLQSNRAATPAQVAVAITSAASTGKISNAGSGSVNALIYSNLTGLTPGPVLPPASSPAPPTPPAPAISVGALTGNAWMDRSKWRSSVTVAVKNGSNQLVAGVTVKGIFSVGGKSVNCKTAANGTCVINSGSLATTILETGFTVTALQRSGMLYDPASNAATSITIARP